MSNIDNIRVESFKIADWEDPQTGLIVDENNDWILVKHIPVDYVIDGYKVYKKSFVEKRIHGEKERKIEKVLKLKGVRADEPKGFEFGDTLRMLEWSEENYGLFEFQDESEDQTFYGRINTVEEGMLVIDYINTEGELDEEFDYEFEIDQIRTITFETDYFISMVLLWENWKSE